MHGRPRSFLKFHLDGWAAGGPETRGRRRARNAKRAAAGAGQACRDRTRWEPCPNRTLL